MYVFDFYNFDCYENDTINPCAKRCSLKNHAKLTWKK